jgi:hypothetical protein
VPERRRQKPPSSGSREDHFFALEDIEWTDLHVSETAAGPVLREARQLILPVALAFALAGCGGVGGGATAIVETELVRAGSSRPFVKVTVRTRSDQQRFIVRLTFLGRRQRVLGHDTVEVPVSRSVVIRVSRAVRNVRGVVEED